MAEGARGVDRYFAYGSNMDEHQMVSRGMEVLGASAAVLGGYRLSFTYDATERWGGGAADVVVDGACSVEGVLYRIGNDISVMDHWEGVHEGGYRRIQVTVVVPGAPEVEEGMPAWTYEVVGKLPYMRPSRLYLSQMVRGAEAAGLSPGYLRWMRLHHPALRGDLDVHLSTLRSLMGEEGECLAIDAAVLEDLSDWGLVELQGGPAIARVRPEAVDDLLGILG